MTNNRKRLRLAVYDLASGTTSLPDRDGAVYFLYVEAGSAETTDDGATVSVGADDGRFVSGQVSVADGARAWLYEKVDADAPLLEAEIALADIAEPDFAEPFVVRADRVESTPGARTPRHGHRGPGLRRLIFGQLQAEVGEGIRRIRAGEAWFETGAEPVVGINTGGTNAAFVRLLVLPNELAGGKSSFVAADETEAAKPRSVNLRLFGETA
ncbi:hypothetical protein [Microbaculum marinisediminis]|uniref:Uncharacterized protein n=1 Tax=Microbaculum marinisediminis TaxID=2931392 RepID=A0AAW5R713_9HYPH|nr:hypothetical protein [Microbaculum sp. A6E488]MCT8974285.1 hypothetical protein [Microbaculum sp. A6E488]